MTGDPNADFYVGYRARTSSAIAARIRRMLAALYVLAGGLAVALVAGQGEFADATFEYARPVTLTGRLSAAPYPTLRIEDGAVDRPFLLVGVGKHGAGQVVAGLDGRRVEATGERIYRDDQWMLQIGPGSVAPLASHVAATERMVSRGVWRLGGEIVDSKCYLGVMQPGRGKPHRSCAARCISGGVPPIFLVTDRQGRRLHLLMIGADDQPLGAEVLGRVGEPLEIEGEVLTADGLWFLRADIGGAK